MSEEDLPSEWEKYFDHESNAYYWHNSLTGESRWEGDDTNDISFPEETTSSEKKSKSKRKSKSKDRELSSVEDAPAPMSETKKKGRRKKKHKRRDDDEDDEFVDLLREQDVNNRTGADINRYRQCFYLNVLLLEYPLVVLEGCVRATVLAAMAVALLVAFMAIWSAGSGFAAQKCFSYLYLTCREVILTAAATLTLVIPFMILFVYRDYDAEHAWDLCALPTIVGTVDARRFGVVTLGHGSDADNVNVLVETKPPGRSSGGIGPAGRTHDSWGGGNIDNICLFPRVFLTHLLE
mmetsp:Transcript_5998/g.9752  ORF Transcript_5998/g.9752 Transcript_5998/m.9752 type:complete len:293 (-) Transcript_5998:2663-3541(-)|eukprot:CAMPEP_0114414178 /NCGR_PEP_ID=MMETSP0103-20121206/1249_1 /TAXON_ID=37642 ORGANISM="Paraphysomonas imperforata, Strain PA2" /NCGR_SAMPLE_ID=MMETSP0103 /ASSEMBLY_ACC=CAM_ASM_000201 /LENGTH=292 /DNA_ID=CAMNT_0001582301 /DNA_START=222 /DNA_END=1100 /DNA_ORIENTATION=+